MSRGTGKVASIHISPEAEGAMRFVRTVRAVPGRGLEGDRYFRAVGTYSDRPGTGRPRPGAGRQGRVPEGAAR